MTVLPHEKPILEVEKTLKQLKEQNVANPLFSKEEIEQMEEKLEQMKASIFSHLKPWDRVAISRHPGRPHAIDYLEGMFDDSFEIFGDRTFRDDPAIITALAITGGEKFVFIGQEKGNSTESRLKRNFGMPHPEGYRKALRAMELAAKFSLPVVTLLDTPGAYPGLAAEERGQGWAIAKNLLEMARLKTPIFVVLIGEGCSGGALGMGIGDRIAMLEHSYYSVISPEGCASILWKDPTKNSEAAKALRMQAEDLLAFGIVDEVLPEPPGGAHYDKKGAIEAVKKFLLAAWNECKAIPIDELIEKRYQKFRRMGPVNRS